jgi:acyl dehydratase
MKEAITLPNTVTSRIKSIINYGIDKLRFTGKVPVGSRIRARVTLAEAITTPKGVQLTYSITVETEGQDHPALKSDNLVLYILG